MVSPRKTERASQPPSECRRMNGFMWTSNWRMLHVSGLWHLQIYIPCVAVLFCRAYSQMYRTNDVSKHRICIILHWKLKLNWTSSPKKRFWVHAHCTPHTANERWWLFGKSEFACIQLNIPQRWIEMSKRLWLVLLNERIVLAYAFGVNKNGYGATSAACTNFNDTTLLSRAVRSSWLGKVDQLNMKWAHWIKC